MARRVQKSKKSSPKKIVQNGIFRRIKFTESYTSLILGAIVVLIVGIIFVFLAKGNKITQTSSIKDALLAESQESQNSNTSSIYTVRPGDDLWTISENVYSNGYRWIEIAKMNKLQNPGLIYSGDKLILPSENQNEKSATRPNEMAGNNSITSGSYTVAVGDSLWDIAVRAYGDGFKWQEIARTNNLTNPNLIHPGNTFKIPR